MSGVKDGDFNRVTISNDLGVGRRGNFGTQGQVLKSGGQGRELTWGSNSATLPEGLVAGANITFTPAGVYNGSVETTISSTNPDGGITTLNGGSGITITDVSATEKTITADIDNDTLGFTSADPKEIEVNKVPNTLTITDSSGASVVFDGSSAKSITISDSDTTYQGGDGIEIDTTTNPDTIKADLKSGSGLIFTGGEIDLDSIPNSALANSTISGKALGTSLSGLTFGSGITATPNQAYDGSTAITITSTDADTTYQAGDGIKIDTSTNPDTIEAIIDSNTLEFIDDPSAVAPAPKLIAVKKVPQVLTFGTGITATPNQAFDGSTAITITSTDADTTLNLIAGTGINIVSSGLDRTLSVTKVPNALSVTTPLLDFVSGGSTYDGSGAREIRPNTQVRRKEINPSSATTYDIYRRVNTNGFPSQFDTMYPIDTNFNLTGVTSIRQASGSSPYGYKVTISFTMLVDIATNSGDNVYVRVDSNNSNVKGYTIPQFICGGQDSGGSNQGHHRHHATFSITHPSSSSTIDLFPVVAVYNTSGSNDSQNNTPRITYGKKFGNLVMDVTPLQVLASESTGNPYTIPASEDDY